jgi:hypothetical protein
MQVRSGASRVKECSSHGLISTLTYQDIVMKLARGEPVCSPDTENCLILLKQIILLREIITVMAANKVGASG